MQLKNLQYSAMRQKKFRDRRNSKLKKICEKHPEATIELNICDKPGRSRIEKTQPQLLQTIVQLVSHGASTDARRRTEILNSCKTLDDLHNELQNVGYSISRSALYTRLLPRRSNTTERKKHITTVPVRLAKAQTSLHKSHPDQYFCVASIRQAEVLASILGPDQVIFLSQDDKARVPLGITAANKQAPILMHVEWKVK